MQKPKKHGGRNSRWLYFLPILSLGILGWSVWDMVAPMWWPEDPIHAASTAARLDSAPVTPATSLLERAEEATLFGESIPSLEDGDAESLQPFVDQWDKLRVLHSDAQRLLAAERLQLPERISELEQLTKQWAAEQAGTGQSRLVRTALRRLELWKDVQRAGDLAEQIQDEFSEGAYDTCAELCSEYLSVTSNYQGTEAEGKFSEASTVEQLQPQIEVLAQALNAYHRAAEQDEDRIVRLSAFIDDYSPESEPHGKRLHDTVSGPEAEQLIEQAELQLAHAKIDLLFDRDGQYAMLPFSIRIKNAHAGFRKYTQPEIRERIRAGVLDWLSERLEPREVPDVHPELRESVAAETGKIAIGIFVPQDEQRTVYAYWITPEGHLKNPDSPDHRVVVGSGESEEAASGQRIAGEPQEPFIVRSVEQYNASAAAVRRQIASEELWRQHAELCGQLEQEAAVTRDLASSKGIGGRRVDGQTQFLQEYREITFRKESKAAQEVLDSFDDVAPVLQD